MPSSPTSSSTRRAVPFVFTQRLSPPGAKPCQQNAVPRRFRGGSAARISLRLRAINQHSRRDRDETSQARVSHARGESRRFPLPPTDCISVERENHTSAVVWFSVYLEPEPSAEHGIGAPSIGSHTRHSQPDASRGGSRQRTRPERAIDSTTTACPPRLPRLPRTHASATRLPSALMASASTPVAAGSGASAATFQNRRELARRPRRSPGASQRAGRVPRCRRAWPAAWPPRCTRGQPRRPRGPAQRAA